MNKKVSCEAIKDLLPNFYYKRTSKEASQIIERHLASCSECANAFKEMVETLTRENSPAGTDEVILSTRKKRIHIVTGIVLSVGIIGILASFIVDMAVNHKLTWSLIVDAGVVYIIAAALAAIFSKKYKILIMAFVSSALIIPLLYFIQYVINKNYMDSPANWVKKYALPITLIWLAILWICILAKYLFRLNIWYALSLFMLLTVIGSALSNAIAHQTSIFTIYSTSPEWIDSLSYLGCAIIFYSIGYLRKNKCQF